MPDQIYSKKKYHQHSSNITDNIIKKVINV